MRVNRIDSVLIAERTCYISPHEPRVFIQHDDTDLSKFFLLKKLTINAKQLP